ncbi:hypothetical protein ACFYV7_38950 [Nocardia suismassiliense]|uniref:Secreted protein n=1 Tax=Nocardia suismassiliense TaxID=2077092 RepID=A0ABW6R5M2_9NOCA
MARLTRIGVVCAAAAALAAPLLAIQPTTAEPLGGWCPGGDMAFNTNPLGMNAVPVRGTFDTTLRGCAGLPAAEVAFHGNFDGHGSCNGVGGDIDGTLQWSNGEVSRVNGRWDVPGGNPAAPKTNIVNIVEGPGEGGRLHIDQAPVDSQPLVGACQNGTAHTGRIPIMTMHFN